MSELHLTRGIPASGKSTYAKGWVAADPLKRARLNRDDFRAMMFGQRLLTFEQEKAVSAAQQAAAKALLGAGMQVMIDDTNLRDKWVRMWYAYAPVIHFHDFEITLPEAIARDKVRAASVGESVVRDYYKRFTNGGILRPAPDNPSVLVGPKTYVPGHMKAVSFDIDGTLAHMGDRRGPYETSKYMLDEVDVLVREALWLYEQAGYRIVILTARSEDFREDTEQWLERMDITYDELLMRPTGDNRNDSIVKSEIVDNHISGQYDIRMHFDDRDRVVNALRDKGIKVAQVNPGNF